MSVPTFVFWKGCGGGEGGRGGRREGGREGRRDEGRDDIVAGERRGYDGDDVFVVVSHNVYK